MLKNNNKNEVKLEQNIVKNINEQISDSISEKDSEEFEYIYTYKTLIIGTIGATMELDKIIKVPKKSKILIEKN